MVNFTFHGTVQVLKSVEISGFYDPLDRKSTSMEKSMEKVVIVDIRRIPFYFNGKRISG